MSGIIKNGKDLNAVIKSGKGTFILFYAEWCPFCVEFLPVFEKHASSGPGSFRRVRVDDIETCEEEYSIEVVPTVIFFKSGKVAKRLDGILGVGLSEKKLGKMIRSAR